MALDAIHSCLAIFSGAIIMLVSIVKAQGIMSVMPLITERHRKKITQYLSIHRTLMVFFLIGYLGVMLAIMFNFHVISESLVSVIFLFGAIFVLMGIVVQSRFLSEIQSTLRGLLPICSKCKKIREQNGEENDPHSWKSIEAFISERTDVNFSHGLCPHCFEHDMKEFKKIISSQNISVIPNTVNRT